jgi:hypothetical protein
VTPLMIKLNMASQWDPGNFKPLDMSKIPGYPRRMPLRYEKWLPKFTGSDEENADKHVIIFGLSFNSTLSVMMLKTWQ